MGSSGSYDFHAPEPTVVIEAKSKTSTKHRIAEFRSQIFALLRRILPAVIADRCLPEESYSPNKSEPAAKADENEARGNWSNQTEFIVSCIGVNFSSSLNHLNNQK